MIKIKYNDIIGHNRILKFFLNEHLSFLNKLIRISLTFLLLPIVLSILSYTHNNLWLSENGFVGMLDDSLFLFSICLVPLQLFVLDFIFRKFMSFIKETENFTNEKKPLEVNTIVSKHLLFLNAKRKRLNYLKYLIIALIMLSNAKALYFRTGGWNSSDFFLEFMLTLFFVLFVVICLIEIVIKLSLLVFIQMRITSELSNNNLIKIEPLSLDKNGSLKSLGDLSLSFTYILIPFILISLTHYMTWGELNIGFVLGLIALATAVVFLFFFPLGTVHNLMLHSKREFLQAMDKEYIILSNNLFNSIKESEEDINELKENAETLEGMYEQAKQMPVWPFDLKIIFKFFTVLLGPLAFIVIEYAIVKILEAVT